MSKLFSLLCYIMPERLVRILFLSSLYGRLFNVRTLDPEIYHKLNRVLEIASNDSALGMGMQFSQAFWNGRGLSVIGTELNTYNQLVLTKEAEKEIVDKIITITPKWLTYSRESMVDDITKMIQHRQELLV